MNIFYPYPKTSSFFTPFLSLVLLLSVLFLQPSHGSVFGESCKKNLDCIDTKFCNPASKKCDCWENPKAGVIQVFDSSKRACFSPAGSLCHVKKVEKHQLNCVHNAECIRTDAENHRPSHFGKCYCIPGYLEGFNRLCEEIEEKIALSSSFVGENSEEYNRPPQAQGVKDDHSNENHNYQISEDKSNKLKEQKDNGVGSVEGKISTIICGILAALTLTVLLVR